jgi:hypothetical protein
LKGIDVTSPNYDPTSQYNLELAPTSYTGLAGTLGDQEGDYPMPTNAQTPGAFGNIFNQMAQAYNNAGLGGVVKGLFSGGVGDKFGQLAAFGGLATLLNKFAGQQAQQPVGYQGGIPEYTVSRQQLPYVSGAENEARRLKQATLDALSTGATLDQVAGAAQRTYGISPGQIDAAMRTEGAYRRPGLGGITYFSPTQYTATGRDLGRSEAGQVSGVAPEVVAGIGGLGPTTGTEGTSSLPTTPTKQTAQQVKPTPKTYSNYQVAQGIYDVLNPAGGGLGTLAQARQGAANLGVTGAQFEASLMPRLSQAIREAQAQMPSATLPQIRDAAMRRYGIDAATFDKAAAITQPTNTQIKQEIQANIDKPQEVAWLANTYGLDTKELSDITGFTDNQVRTYFADNDVPLPSANTELDKYTDEQVAQAIRESMKQGFSLEQSKTGALEKYGVSQSQLGRVLSNNKFAEGGYMPGGIAMLAGGRYLRGPGDGVSDSIPAQFERTGQPARLADGEFVIDARTVSEIGNGSSEAGARKLYAMMDRVHKARKTAKRGKPSGADKFLPK